jgi:hypothetical protein
VSTVLQFTNKVMIYHCKYCESPQNFTVKATSVEVTEAAPPAEFSLAHCTKCNSTALFVREDYGGGFDDDSYYRVYPPHVRALGFVVPPLVKESYDAAVDCENAKIYLPAVVMVGRALEAVCHEYDPNTKGLFQGLQSMLKAGVISKELMEWADELRVLRNVGAHATSDRVDPKDVTESLDFLQAILEILYDLRPKFTAMKARRARIATPKMAAIKNAAPSPPV